MSTGTVKPIPSAPGYYADAQGFIWSVSRQQGICVLSEHPSYSGYSVVSLLVGKKSVRYYVHRLMLEAFVGPLPEGHCSRHLNGDASDNRIVNLAYGTMKQNMEDRGRHGNTSPTRKKREEQLRRDQQRMALMHMVMDRLDYEDELSGQCGRRGPKRKRKQGGAR